MTFPPSLHPNSFSFPSFDLKAKRLEGLKFVNLLGDASLDPPWGHSAPRPPPASLGRCAASPTALRAVHIHTCTLAPPLTRTIRYGPVLNSLTKHLLQKVLRSKR